MKVHIWCAGSWNSITEQRVRALLEGAAFVTWYDTIQTDDDTISPIDLAIPAFLDATPSFKPLLSRADGGDVRDLLKSAAALLKDIPKDRDLWDWDIDEHLLKGLFKGTTGGHNGSLPRFGPARCTKMLHRKRPRLIPIIDSWTRDAWSDQPKSHWTTDEMVQITSDMAARLRDRACEYAHVCTLIESRWSVQVSPLRAYDVVAYLWNRDRSRPERQIP